MILDEAPDVISGELRILRKLSFFPSRQPFRSADPERAVARSEHTRNGARGEMPILWRLPCDTPDTVEAKQSEIRAEPEITVGCLRNAVDRAVEKALAGCPCRVRILTNVQRRIQSE